MDLRGEAVIEKEQLEMRALWCKPSPPPTLAPNGFTEGLKD